MPEQVLLDNDVVLKVTCYALAAEMIAVTTTDLPPAMLGVGRFVIQSRLNRASNVADVDRAKGAFDQFLMTVALLEPDDEELTLAADLEAEANRRDLELDGGESQLLAILARRACRLLITGDKRAVAAMAVVAPRLAGNRIASLEQLMVRLVHSMGFEAVRLQVCSEPAVDRAITSCFACSADRVTGDDVLAGLSSYIRHMDRNSPGMLIRDFDGATVEPSR